VDVDLELGEGDDEPNNSFFDMRGEALFKGQGQGKGDEKEKDKEGKRVQSTGSDRPGGPGLVRPRSSGDSRLR
jgi:hypothetical protein